MMKFKFLLIVLLTSISVQLFANNLADSIGVENQDGKKVIIHKVDPHESFYSIARLYKVDPKTLMAFNNNATTLSIGQTIKVPTDRPFIETVKKPSFANNNFNIRTSPAMEKPVATAAAVKEAVAAQTQVTTTEYKVSAGETLYAISKRFNTTVADITSLNNLKSTTVIPGQIILVRAAPPQATAPAQQPVNKPAFTQQQTAPQTPVQQLPTPIAKRDTTLVAATDSVDLNHRNVAGGRYGLLEKNEKGVAVWMDSDNLDPSKKWVLHRTAPIGTVIKITNPMTNRTTFAKVVGRFTDNENTKDALMVMTKSVAESIGAVDKRFHVIISYGTPNE
ncbi:LysM peptidoglycan-binding domain-containing protein [Mucilaginibacter gracilis]|nr:LysM peptidoglycan-binding domain-containing protein [Mucilaginibacter gracilis]